MIEVLVNYTLSMDPLRINRYLMIVFHHNVFVTCGHCYSMRRRASCIALNIYPSCTKRAPPVLYVDLKIENFPIFQNLPIDHKQSQSRRSTSHTHCHGNLPKVRLEAIARAPHPNLLGKKISTPPCNLTMRKPLSSTTNIQEKDSGFVTWRT